MCVGEVDARSRHAIDSRGGHCRVRVICFNVAPAEIVGENEHHIGASASWCGMENSGRGGRGFCADVIGRIAQAAGVPGPHLVIEPGHRRNGRVGVGGDRRICPVGDHCELGCTETVSVLRAVTRAA